MSARPWIPQAAWEYTQQFADPVLQLPEADRTSLWQPAWRNLAFAAQAEVLHFSPSLTSADLNRVCTDSLQIAAEALGLPEEQPVVSLRSGQWRQHLSIISAQIVVPRIYGTPPDILAVLGGLWRQDFWHDISAYEQSIKQQRLTEERQAALYRRTGMLVALPTVQGQAGQGQQREAA